MTLTKAELSDLLFEKLGLNKTEAKDFVETFFDEIRGSLEKGEDVKLSGFGNFHFENESQVFPCCLKICNSWLKTEFLASDWVLVYLYEHQ